MGKPRDLSCVHGLLALARNDTFPGLLIRIVGRPHSLTRTFRSGSLPPRPIQCDFRLHSACEAVFPLSQRFQLAGPWRHSVQCCYDNESVWAQRLPTHLLDKRALPVTTTTVVAPDSNTQRPDPCINTSSQCITAMTQVSCLGQSRALVPSRA